MDITIIPEVGAPASSAQIQITKPISEYIFVGSIVGLKNAVLECDLQLQAIKDKKLAYETHLADVETRFIDAGITDITKPVTAEQADALNT